MDRIVATEQVQAVKHAVDTNRRFVIVCHVTPDGDALGSSLCLWQMLTAMGKSAVVITPDVPPQHLMFLPGSENIIPASCHPVRAASLLSKTDVVFCLDFNDFQRIDRMRPMLEQSPAMKIMVDHHLNPVADADILISRPQEPSTCSLLYTIAHEAGWTERFLNTDGATCCYTGMMTDTGNFSYNSNHPHLYTIVAQLVAKGVDKDAIYNRVMNTNSLRRLKIMAYAQYAKMEVMPQHRCALITLSKEELEEFGYTKGDTESLVNVPLSIPGVVYSVYMREDESDFVKVSMRSRGDFSVKEICESHFGGGGHHNAAGGEIRTSLDAAVTKLLEILPLYDHLLTQQPEQ